MSQLVTAWLSSHSRVFQVESKSLLWRQLRRWFHDRQSRKVWRCMGPWQWFWSKNSQRSICLLGRTQLHKPPTGKNSSVTSQYSAAGDNPEPTKGSAKCNFNFRMAYLDSEYGLFGFGVWPPTLVSKKCYLWIFYFARVNGATQFCSLPLALLSGKQDFVKLQETERIKIIFHRVQFERSNGDKLRVPVQAQRLYHLSRSHSVVEQIASWTHPKNDPSLDCLFPCTGWPEPCTIC